MVKERTAFYKALMMEVYTQCNPEKIAEVDRMLLKYVGHEEDLYSAVCWRYDVEEND